MWMNFLNQPQKLAYPNNYTWSYLNAEFEPKQKKLDKAPKKDSLPETKSRNSPAKKRISNLEKGIVFKVDISCCYSENNKSNIFYCFIYENNF